VGAVGGELCDDEAGDGAGAEPAGAEDGLESGLLGGELAALGEVVDEAAGFVFIEGEGVRILVLRPRHFPPPLQRLL